ncbi:SIMPL domain-containing protein [Massilia sp. SR12]
MRITRVFALLVLCAASVMPASASMPSHPFVSTSGKAQLWMRPDIGELKFEAGTQNASAETAAAQLQELSASVMQLMAEYGVQPADIEAHELDKKSVPVSGSEQPAYSLGRIFNVRVRDLAQWPALMARLVEMDHITSINTTFDRTDGDDLNTQLMSAAADDARGKAGSLAKAFGRKLGPVVAIARGPLDKVGAPFIEQQPGKESRGVPGPNAGSGKYTIPDSIPYSQTVNAIFVLK